MQTDITHYIKLTELSHTVYTCFSIHRCWCSSKKHGLHHTSGQCYEYHVL